MSRLAFENYGAAARDAEEQDFTQLAGRYTIQRRAERLVAFEIAAKLELGPDDRLLEIGCGPGNLLIPLSFAVAQATGLDHPDVCARFSERFYDGRCRLIGANFLDYDTTSGELFDKIMIYSVISTLESANEAFAFVDKALTLLAPNGRLLVGDIVNLGRKARFQQSMEGKKFDKEWKEQIAREPMNVAPKRRRDNKVFEPGDEFIAELFLRYRRKGYDTFVVPQSSDLPFGHTREDVLICHRA